MKCSECKGSGTYVGFTAVEPCRKCGGKGEVTEHVPAVFHHEGFTVTFEGLNKADIATTQVTQSMGWVQPTCKVCGRTTLYGLNVLPDRTEYFCKDHWDNAVNGTAC